MSTDFLKWVLIFFNIYVVIDAGISSYHATQQQLTTFSNGTGARFSAILSLSSSLSTK